MFRNQICLFSSEFAACLGKNPYVNQYDAIQKVYCRVNKIEKETPADQVLKELDHSIIEKLHQSIGEIQDTKQVVEKIQQIQKDVVNHLNLTPEKKEILKEYVREKHNTSHGTKSEEKICQNFSETKQIQITKDDIFRKKVLFENDEFRILIGGKCDGISQETNTIVEIKNRMKKLFRYIPEYEKIQIYTYMYIYEIHQAKLIENYRGKTLEHHLEYNDEYFQELLNREIPIFCEIYQSFLKSD